MSVCATGASRFFFLRSSPRSSRHSCVCLSLPFGYYFNSHTWPYMSMLAMTNSIDTLIHSPGPVFFQHPRMAVHTLTHTHFRPPFMCWRVSLHEVPTRPPRSSACHSPMCGIGHDVPPGGLTSTHTNTQTDILRSPSSCRIISVPKIINLFSQFPYPH